MPILARAALIAFAMLACGWFALATVQARDTQRATAIVNGSAMPSSAQAARARSLIESAKTLNPDLTPDILRGELAIDENDDARAERIFESAVGREPMNIAAWVQLAIAAKERGDRRLFNGAVREISALEPKIK